MQLAQSNLAIIYENGDGVKKDTKKAFELYSSAAEQGYQFTLYNLASFYENGEAVEKIWLKRLSYIMGDRAG